MRRLPLVFLISAALASAQETVPAEPAEIPAPPPVPLSLTVSGGVSLGAYEAGYLYYLDLLFHLNPKVARPRIFTGASAGSANAILALISSCAAPDFDATGNLFFRSWIPLGIKTLFDPNDVSPISALSRKPGSDALERIERRWNQGLPTSCDAVLGLSVTRVTAEPLELTNRVRLPRTSAKFVVRVQGQGEGQAPRLTNYVASEGELNRPLLPEDDLGRVDFGALRQALEASAAFPLAFAPRPVNHCSPNRKWPLSDERNGVLIRCPRAEATSTLFYDGGVFDNQPLLLATQVARRGLIYGAARVFRDAPDVTKHTLDPEVRFLYLDPDTELLPELHDAAPPPFESTIPYAVYLLGELVGSARTAELQALLDETPEVKGQLGATLTYYRPLSGALLNFFGFFDTDVRMHDFALGMHDAARFVDEVVVGWSPGVSLVRPEVAMRQQPQAVQDSWRLFECQRAVLSGVGGVDRCFGLPPNLLIGTQVTLEKLYARCNDAFARALKEGRPVPSTVHAQCTAAIDGKSPPRVPGLSADDEWKFRKDESPFDYQLRRMQSYGYQFRDLDLEPGQSARRKIAKQLNLITQRMGGSGNDLLIKSMGRAYTQSLEYVPPDHTLSVLFGNNLEVGYTFSRGDNKWGWVRLHGSLGLEGLLTLIGPDRERFFRLQPRIGAELEPVPLSSTAFQFRAGARAGFQFSTADTFLLKPCDRTLPCSRPAVDFYTSVTFFQWVRLQLGIEWQPPFLDLAGSVSLRPSLGLEIDWP